METKNKEDKSTWAIGGGLLAGLGTGFFFFHSAALIFVGCTIAGLGVGLIITAIIAGTGNRD